MDYITTELKETELSSLNSKLAKEEEDEEKEKIEEKIADLNKKIIISNDAYAITDLLTKLNHRLAFNK